jgi:hypothetical protein
MLDEDRLIKPDWLVKLKTEITDILQGEDPLIKKIDSLAHLVIRERADLVQEISDLKMPSDWE